ncbi:acyl-CoA dehydrogenase family protein [Candidatus Palauibacter sp.]|uniref:acyl-CoA dehydrogenase family protein n=1 Tax=Candidatus Palauibacter sp. TaxID=3101350 RepID=UPI003B016380
MTSHRRSYTALQLSSEAQQILELARQFAEERLRPTAEARDANEDVFDGEIHRELGELGFLAMRVPERYEGLGLDLATYLYVLEELAWGDPGVAVSVSVHNSLPVSILLRHGNEAQRTRWLPRMASGEVLGAFSLSEAGAGTDAAALRTQATRTDGGWVINGEKMWVTNGASAGVVLMFARTDAPEDRRGTRGIGAFLLPAGVEGLSVGRKERKMGQRGSETVTLALKDVFLEDELLIGDPNRGFAYALEGLEGGRLGIAAQALGIASAAVDAAFEYAQTREQFGRPIRKFQGMEFKLGDMVTRLEAARGLVERAAAAHTVGDPRARRLSSVAKLFSSETAMRNARDAVQVFGGYGYSREYPVERLFRDAKVTEIYEGANEMHRSLIARQLYREGGYA